jgi:hypothetical protein
LSAKDIATGVAVVAGAVAVGATLKATAPISIPVGVVAGAGSVAFGAGAVSLGASGVSTAATCIEESSFNRTCVGSVASTTGGAATFGLGRAAVLSDPLRAGTASFGRAFTGIGLVIK